MSSESHADTDTISSLPTSSKVDSGAKTAQAQPAQEDGAVEKVAGMTFSKRALGILRSNSQRSDSKLSPRVDSDTGTPNSVTPSNQHAHSRSNSHGFSLAWLIGSSAAPAAPEDSQPDA